MEERKACTLLKQRFEAAGFHIEANRAFAEAGVSFEIDGFDPERRVGYEYITAEAGDSWDVDGDVIAALDARREAGELFILLVDEADAPDESALAARIDTFLASLPKEPSAKKKPAAKKKEAAAVPKPAKVAKPKAAKPAAKRKVAT